MFTLIIYILMVATGFMMGYLYKKANTTSRLLSPKPDKALKIFVAVLVTAVLITFGLSYFTTEVLHSSGLQEVDKIKYNNLKSVMIFAINISFFLLIILSNVYSQSLKKFAAVPYVLAFCFYMLFILKDAYVITDYYLLWQKSLQLIKGDIPEHTQLAWAKCFLGLVVTSFNALMIWWGLRK